MSIRINGQVIASTTDITDYSKKTGNETLSGVKTFSSSPIIPTPAYTDNSTNAANTEWIRNNIAPAGSVMIWAGTTVPTGYLLCDGSAVSRTTYSDLFSAIGTTYGVGDGSSTFNLPNGKAFLGSEKIPVYSSMPTGIHDTYFKMGELPSAQVNYRVLRWSNNGELMATRTTVSAEGIGDSSIVTVHLEATIYTLSYMIKY